MVAKLSATLVAAGLCFTFIDAVPASANVITIYESFNSVIGDTGSFSLALDLNAASTGSVHFDNDGTFPGLFSGPFTYVYTAQASGFDLSIGNDCSATSCTVSGSSDVELSIDLNPSTVVTPNPINPGTDGFSASGLVINYGGTLPNGAPLDAAASASFTPAPGPVVGAGLPGLILAGAGLLGWMRRKKNAVAATV